MSLQSRWGSEAGCLQLPPQFPQLHQALLALGPLSLCGVKELLGKAWCSSRGWALATWALCQSSQVLLSGPAQEACAQ